MEYIETTINKIAKYNNLLERWTNKILGDSFDADEMLKSFKDLRKIFEIIGKLFFPKTTKKKYFESYFNECYTALRKLHIMLSDHEKGSVFSKGKTKRDIEQCLKRNEFLIEDYLKTIKRFEKKYSKKVPPEFTKQNIPLLDNETVFLLSIRNQIYIPLSCENIFVNMVLYKDQVYYVETNDVISFFYFYRSDEAWYWSPPKKTDPEDIWIECPIVTIGEGYWTGKIIPSYMAQFIIWLDMFFPNIPEAYLKKAGIKKEEELVENNKGKQNNAVQTNNIKLNDRSRENNRYNAINNNENDGLNAIKKNIDEKTDISVVTKNGEMIHQLQNNHH